MNYGAPEEFSSDGGPQFTSISFQNFLKKWRVQHQLSSVGYPQFSGRDEAAVKTAKHIIQDNTSKNGSTATKQQKQYCITVIHHYQQYLLALHKYYSTENFVISLPVISLTINSTKTGLLHMNNKNTRLLSKTSTQHKDTMLLHMNLKSYQLILQCSSQTPATICNIKKWDKTCTVIEVVLDQQFTTFIQMVPALLSQ